MDYVVTVSVCPRKMKRTLNLAQNGAVHSFHFVCLIQIQILGYKAGQNKEQIYFMILHEKMWRLAG